MPGPAAPTTRLPTSSCDLSRGRWVREARPATYYTNETCATIPESKNCFYHGRRDKGFLNWRWRPYGCEVPRFDPNMFLEMVRGKTMAFVGDSVARNHFDSLLCLLSQAEKPDDVYKDKEDRFRRWRFPGHDFTLRMLWSKFLVYGEEKPANNTFPGGNYLYFDRLDDKWAGELPGTDIVVISSGHWFFRPINLYDGSNKIGCVYCNEPNVTSYGPEYAIRLAFRAALRHINEECHGCEGMLTLLRTFSPAHFENGTWDTGGSCPRTKPRGDKGVRSKWTYEMGFRDRQVEEVRKVGEEGMGKGKRFGVVDVTEASVMRPDGHPNGFWGNKWMRGYNDCVHWCLPGPIDSWNEMLMEVLRREIIA
ncbi:hypothetical protein MLD38_033930 [Melastoma candidum]|uniref:Uncharacterized protein n=1 Tax=Melastoma candidum TaxID=119954 RepID=A0ACB9M8X0_9MYRT|nr:hypothetical protein MLD38_033930 [Melastoma candidum]